MAERQFQDLTAAEPFWNDKDIKEGATLEGKILLMKPSRGPKSSPVMLVETDDGKKINVWMKTIIASSLEGVAKEGDVVRLTYNGLKKAQNGGTDYHDYKVELARQ